MNKIAAIILLIIVLFLNSYAIFAQDSTKVQYRTSVTLPVTDITTFLQVLAKYRDVQMYYPKFSESERTRIYLNLDAYIAELERRIKVDSVRIDSVKVKPSKKK